MGKPPALRIPSDDCAVTIAGGVYHPHEGEWVEVIPGLEVGDFETLSAIASAGPEMESLQADTELPELADGEQHAPEHLARAAAAVARLNQIAAQRTNMMAEALSGRLLRWNWTDMRGQPLPCPSDHPDVLKRLRLEELSYLTRAVKGEIEVQRKNGSRPLPITSSATTSRGRTGAKAN